MAEQTERFLNIEPMTWVNLARPLTGPYYPDLRNR